MEYLKIKNKGLVEAEAFNLIGASTKVNEEDKIGMFGSGTKYAIAFFMRNNIDVKIFSGDTEIRLEKESVSMRGMDFQKIIINGQPTSLTTTMGKDWECWMAIREIYCNAIDEGDFSKEVTSEVKKEPDCTNIYIQATGDVLDVISNWGDYFSEEKTPMFEDKEKGVKLFGGGDCLRVYRKGILCCHEPKRNTIFSYDMPDIEINESRVVKSDFEMRYSIGSYIYKDASKQVIRRFIDYIKGSWEENLTFSMTLSRNWQEVIGDTPIVEIELEGYYQSLIDGYDKVYVLPRALCSSLLRQFNTVRHVAGKSGKNGAKIKPITPLQDGMIQKAFDFFKECNYEVTSPINVCEFEKKNIIGQAIDGEIYLSDQAFNGLYDLVLTLIEEQEHINTGFEDETRDFQSHFMKLFLNEKIQRFSYIL